MIETVITLNGSTINNITIYSLSIGRFGPQERGASNHRLELESRIVVMSQLNTVLEQHEKSHKLLQHNETIPLIIDTT